MSRPESCVLSFTADFSEWTMVKYFLKAITHIIGTQGNLSDEIGAVACASKEAAGWSTAWKESHELSLPYPTWREPCCLQALEFDPQYNTLMHVAQGSKWAKDNNTNQHEMPNQQQNPGSSTELLFKGEMQLPRSAALAPSAMAASDQPEELDHVGPPALL